MHLPNDPKQIERMASKPHQSSDDAYPKVIADQRELYRRNFTNAAEVMDYWRERLAAKNKELVADPKKRSVIPYVNHSRWLARCPECNNAIECWDENPYAACLDDGHYYEVNWQLPDDRAEVARLLAIRPVDMRSWEPHKGETVQRLRDENEFLVKVGALHPRQLVIAKEIPDEKIGTKDDLSERLSGYQVLDPARRDRPQPHWLSSREEMATPTRTK